MQEQELSLKDYIEVVKKRKISVLLVFLIAVIGSAVLSFVLPPVYQVKSTIKIGQIVDLSTFEKTPIESAVAGAQFLEGSAILTQAIEDLKLPFTLKKLRKKISAEPIGQEEDLVEIRIEMSDSEQALSVAGYLTTKLVERHSQIKLQHEDKTALLTQYDEHIASLHKQLLEVDKNKNDIVIAHDEQAKGLSEQLAMNEAHKKEALSEYDLRIKVINEQLADIKDDISKAKEELGRMREEFEPLSEAESRLLVGYMDDIKSKENRYDSLMKESRETQVKNTELLRNMQVEFDVLMEELRQIQLKKTELLRSAGGQYDTLMEQLREIQTEKTKLQRIESTTMYTTELIVPPEKPEEPIRPNIPLNMVVAAVIGLLVGLGLIFSLESLGKAK